MHRPTLAVLVIVMALGAVCLWIWPPAAEDSALAGLHGSLVRMSIVLGALWFAEPHLRRYPAWLVLAFLVGSVLLLAGLRSPGFYRLAVPVLVILWLTRRMKRTPEVSRNV